MSEGFNKWSNNPNTDPNIVAIRWGEQKPILETELNEMQDLAFQQKIRENLTSRKHSTYSAVNCELVVEYYSYLAKNQPSLAQYFDLDTSSSSTDSLLIVALNVKVTDTTKSAFITFNFGGGLEYTFSPTTQNNYIYMQVFPKERAVPYSGQVPIDRSFSVILQAQLNHLSPDSSDSNYDASVSFALDRRAGNTTTQRVVIQSGFNDEILLTDDDFETVFAQIDAERILSFNDEILLTDEPKKVSCLLFNWIPQYKNDTHFELTNLLPRYEIQQISKYIPTKSLKMLPDFDNVVGTYTATPLYWLGSTYYWEIQIDLAFKSCSAGYVGVSKGTLNTLPTDIYPVNRIITVSTTNNPSSQLRFYLFSLEDILDDNKCYESTPFKNISWEVLLNQDWFHTKTSEVPNLSPSFVLKMEKVANIGDIEVGRLVIA